VNDTGIVLTSKVHKVAKLALLMTDENYQDGEISNGMIKFYEN
jgi:hypothetical protein